MKWCTLEPGGLFTTKDFAEGVQTLDMAIRAITDMPACSLKLLAVEVRSASKQFFWGTPSFAFVVLHYLRTEAPPF